MIKVIKVRVLQKKCNLFIKLISFGLKAAEPAHRASVLTSTVIVSLFEINKGDLDPKTASSSPLWTRPPVGVRKSAVGLPVAAAPVFGILERLLQAAPRQESYNVSLSPLITCLLTQDKYA